MSFTANISSNIDAVLAAVERQRLPEPEYTGEIVNDAPYASYLHDRMAYWVMNDSVLAANYDIEVRKAMDAAASQGQLFDEPAMIHASLNALERTVEYYVSVIGTKNTAGRHRPPPRPLHPGSWADDSGLLVVSYVSYLRAAGRIIDFNPYDHPSAAFGDAPSPIAA